MGTQTAPALLAVLAGAGITVVDGHAQTELDAALQVLDGERRLRELDLVGGPLGRAIAGHDRLGATGAGLVHDDGVAQIAFHAAEGVVVEGHLLGAVGAGDHQLDGVAVPGALGGVLVVIVGDHETEVDVLGVEDDLHGRGLVIGTGPGAAAVLFEQDILAVRAGTLGDGELRVGQHGHALPLVELAIDGDGSLGTVHRVELLARLDVVLLLEGDLGGLARGLAEHDGVGTEAAPALLSVLTGAVVAVIDGHAQAELHATFELGDVERGLRQLDLIDGALAGAVAGHHGLGATGAGLMHHDHVAEVAFHATEGVVVEGHLLAAVGAGDHQLDGVAVPGALGGVLVVVVGDHEAEVDVLGIVHDLDGRGLVIRAGPGAPTIFLEQHVLARALGAGALGYGELRVGKDRHPRPFVEATIQHDGFRGEDDRIGVLARFDVVGRGLGRGADRHERSRQTQQVFVDLVFHSEEAFG